MSDLPRRRQAPIFKDDFTYRGHLRLPGSSSIPDHWSIVSGSFTTSSEVHLECSEIGELLYNGTSLNNLRNYGDQYNFAFKYWLVGQEDIVFSIRTRRLDATHYLNAEFNFENDSVTLHYFNGSVEQQVSASHDFATEKFYLLEMWNFDEESSTRCIVLVNGSVIIDTPITNPPLSDGFSINITQLSTQNSALINAVKIYELFTQPVPGPITDPSDLLLQHHIEVKNTIENPTELTWSSFKNAYMNYKHLRKLGRSDEDWEQSGYPIRQPMTEEWFL